MLYYSTLTAVKSKNINIISRIEQMWKKNVRKKNRIRICSRLVSAFKFRPPGSKFTLCWLARQAVQPSNWREEKASLNVGIKMRVVKVDGRKLQRQPIQSVLNSKNYMRENFPATQNGDADLENYRPIRLLSHIHMLLTRTISILLTRQ